MYEINFECEVVTPMFLSGADGKTAELRAPSIKGAMRFWWRAMNGYLSVEKLKEREVEIFGGSGENQGRSKVILMVKMKNKIISYKDFKKEYNLYTQFDKNKGTIIGKDSGIAYLLYSTFLKGKEKKFYKERTTFNVTLRSFEEEVLRQAIAAFWSLSFLGSLGSRSRRGGGNFKITKIDDKSRILDKLGLDFFLKESSQDKILNWLLNNFRKANKIVNSKNKTKFIYEYSNLSLSRFIVSKKSFSSWRDALNNIGKIYKEFRTKNKWDIFGTSAFGLPRKHVKTSDDKNYQRRSSPIIIKILESNKKYYWFVLRFVGQFLPENVILMEDKKDNPGKEKVTYSKLDEFWNEIKIDNEEVILYIPDKVRELKNKIIEFSKPSKIILFGSLARGNFHKKSDIDIAIEGAKNFIEANDIIENLDIVNIEKIDENFKNKITEEGIILWKRD